MKLEQQVCSLELAKRLKEFGVKQESLWYWQRFNSMGKLKWAISNTTNSHCASAFTVAELGEMLPIFEDYGSPVTSKLFLRSEGFVFHCGYLDNENGASEVHCTIEFFGKADTEADPRAKMLIYLLEKKLTTLQ
jgi:hypothetical protein